LIRKLIVLKILLIIIPISFLLTSCSKKNVKREDISISYKGRIYIKSVEKSYKSYFTLKEYRNKIEIYFYSKFGNDLGYIIYKNNKDENSTYKFSFGGSSVNVHRRYKKLFGKVLETFHSKKFNSKTLDEKLSIEFSEKRVNKIPKEWIVTYFDYKIRLIFYE